MDICRRCGDQPLLFQKAAQRTRPKPLSQVNAGGSRKTSVSKTRSTNLNTESESMVQRYVKTMEKHLKRAFSTHQWDLDDRPLIFLLAYRRYAHGTTPLKVFGRQHLLLSNLYFGASADNEVSMTDFSINLSEPLNDIRHFERRHLMKSRHGQLATQQGFKMTIKLEFNPIPGREGYLNCSLVMKTRS